MKTLTTLTATAALMASTAIAQEAYTGDATIDARVATLLDEGYDVYIRKGIFGTRVEADNDITDTEITLVYRGGELVREDIETDDDLEDLIEEYGYTRDELAGLSDDQIDELLDTLEDDYDDYDEDDYDDDDDDDDEDDDDEDEDEDEDEVDDDDEDEDDEDEDDDE